MLCNGVFINFVWIMVAEGARELVFPDSEEPSVVLWYRKLREISLRRDND